MGAFSSVSGATLLAAAAVAWTTNARADCAATARNRATTELSCHLALPVSDDNANVSAATSGLIKSYGCNIDVQLKLTDFDTARAASTPIAIPSHPFTCQIVTSGGNVQGSGKVAGVVTSVSGKVADVRFTIEETSGFPGVVLRLARNYLERAESRARAAAWLEQVLSARAPR